MELSCRIGVFPDMKRVLLLTAATASLALAQQGFTLQDNRDQELTCSRIRFCEMREEKPSPSSMFSVEGIHNGSIHVRGWARNEVLVRWRVSTDSFNESDAQTLFKQIHTRVSGSRASVDGPRDTSFWDWMNGSRWDVSVEIFVPHQTTLRLATHNGLVAVSDIAGKVDAQSHNGTVRMERVQGGVNASTHNGTIRLASISGPVAFENHNGTVNLTGLYSDVRGSAHNGSILVELAGNSIPTRTIDMQTHNSTMTLGMPSGFSAHVRSDTHNASVHSDFPTTVPSKGGMRRIGPGLPDSFEIGSGGMSVRLRTHNGGIRLKRL